MKHPFFTFAITVALTGCGGTTLAPSNTSSGSAPSSVVLRNGSGNIANTLAFSGAGSSNAQSLVATQLDGSTPLHESDTCSSPNGVASVTTQSSSNATATFTVTPLKAGSCTITVSGANGYSATLDVSITVTNVPIQ